MSILDKDLQKIWQNVLFDGVDRTNAKKIFDETDVQVCSFENGELLRSPESREKAAGLLLSGKAVVTTPDPKRNTLLRFLEPGAVFGIANLFSDLPYVSRIRSHGSCRVCFLPESTIKQLLESDSAFLYQYLGFLSGRIRYLNQKIGYLTAGSPERRLALYLTSLGKSDLRLDASISALSDLLDIGRASLYRAFDKLTEDGFIQKDGRHIILLDADGMLSAYH